MFKQMLEVLDKRNPTRRTPAKLSNVDKILPLLMYYQEYRIQFYIGVIYGISESRVGEIIKETDSILIWDSHFYLPYKKGIVQRGKSI